MSIKSFSKLFFFISLVFCFVSCGGGGGDSSSTSTTGSISGTASLGSTTARLAPSYNPGSSGAALSGAIVYVTDYDGNSYDTATTDANGNFTVSNLPASKTNYIIKIIKDKIVLRTMVSSITAGQTTTNVQADITTTALVHMIEKRIKNETGQNITLGETGIIPTNVKTKIQNVNIDQEKTDFKNSIQGDSSSANPIYVVYATIVAVTETANNIGGFSLEEFLNDPSKNVSVILSDTTCIKSNDVIDTGIKNLKVVSSLSVSPSSANVNQGLTQQFTITATYTDGTTANVSDSVVYERNVNTRGTISNGLFNANGGLGEVIITVKYLGISTNFTINVLANTLISSITISINNNQINVGDTKQLIAIGTYFNGDTVDITQQVSWFSSLSSIARIDLTSGILHGIDSGLTTISATSTNNITSNNINISVFRRIELISSYSVYNLLSVFKKGSYCYIGDYSASLPGLMILNVSNPKVPTLIGSNSYGGGPTGIFVKNNIAYMSAGFNGLKIIDVSNPTNPSSLNPNNSGMGQSIYTSGDYAYIGHLVNNRRLEIYNISNPANPVLTGSYTSLENPREIYVTGNYAYIADAYSGLQIINISNPANPILAGQYNTSDYALGVYVKNNIAYVADVNDGLYIIDVSNPANPTLISTHNTFGVANDVFVSGNYAYIAASSGGLKIVDISDSTNPVTLGDSISSGLMAGELFVDGDYVYLTSQGIGNPYDGLKIIRANSYNNSNPVITSQPITIATVGNNFSYNVIASDADNDTLIYSLLTHPQNMQINSSTGLITWTPSATGNYSVEIEVFDGKLGGTVKQYFDINVTQ